MRPERTPAAEANAPEEHLQVRLGAFLGSKALLRRALTHPSAAQEAGLGRAESYERLEFLGDSLLNFAVAEILWERFPGLSEGDLTKLRAYWVSGASLAKVAREVGVPEALKLGAGEERGGGRAKERILASVLEALFAAVYEDAGWRAARALLRRLFTERIWGGGLAVLKSDHKTILQEWRQARSLPLPEYRTELGEAGFLCRLFLDGTVRGEGRGRSRKSAERAAAEDVLKAMEESQKS